MAVQLSVATRTAMASAIDTTLGNSGVLRVFVGAQPANCAAADSGSLLAEITLPADTFGAAASGAVAKAGTWSDASANNTGTAGHWRMYQTGGTVCVAQGNITATGGGGDLTLTTTSITSGQPVEITAFTFTAGNI